VTESDVSTGTELVVRDSTTAAPAVPVLAARTGPGPVG